VKLCPFALFAAALSVWVADAAELVGVVAGPGAVVQALASSVNEANTATVTASRGLITRILRGYGLL
jgi:hypothetical protein